MEVGGELLKKQNERLEVQFKTGLRTIEEAFRLAEAKDSEDLRARTIKLWQKTFDCLGQISEVEIRGLHNVLTRWTELMNKGHRPTSQPFRATGVNETKPDEGEGIKVPGRAKSDREELKEAMLEYEMTKGDWSKGR